MPEYVYLLVKILRGTQPGEPRLSRPPNWSAEEIHFNSTGTATRCGGIGAGGDVEWELWKIRTAVAEKYAAAFPKRYEILDETDGTDVYRWCQKQRGVPVDPDDVPVGEEVTDRDRLEVVRLKLGAELGLSQDDVDALDPAKAVPGVQARLTEAAEVYRDGPPIDTVKAAEARTRAKGSEPFLLPRGIRRRKTGPITSRL